jgi:hypothetical protein
MNYKVLISAVLIVTAVSCKHEQLDTAPVVIVTPPPPLPMLLKDIVIPNLPSPYYHFEYNPSGSLAFASFASDYFRFDVKYEGQRVSEMVNNVFANSNKLQFVYDNAGRIKLINYIDMNGSVYRKFNLTYDGSKLTGMERQIRFNNDFITNKTMSMSYYADTNLFQLKVHYPAIDGQPESNYTITYDQYDNKFNADDFMLLHNEFFEPLIILPGVRLQKNNPGKETLSGVTSSYTVNYLYTYNDKNLPLDKKGDLTWTSGPDAGKKFQTSQFYSYY